MAMNRAERVKMKELQDELTRAKAWRRTEPVEKDVEIPSGYGGVLVKGWSFCAGGNNPRVEVSCSDSVHHSFGTNDKTRMQRPIQQYSSKLLALKALRFEVEELCIDQISKVDRMIEEEIRAQKGSS